MALRRDRGPRQSGRERKQLRGHLRELDELRDAGIVDLGGLALEMHRQDRFDDGLLGA